MVKLCTIWRREGRGSVPGWTIGVVAICLKTPWASSIILCRPSEVAPQGGGRGKTYGVEILKSVDPCKWCTRAVRNEHKIIIWREKTFVNRDTYSPPTTNKITALQSGFEKKSAKLRQLFFRGKQV